ncbi:MAG TPA: hypothetical protein PK299_01910 [Anaerolineales bacterium]|nr:hypothetical protein [Anaerolineales bacterium]
MPDLQPVFDRLKLLLQTTVQDRLTVLENGASDYILSGPYWAKYKKPAWFGGVQLKKNYVSFHLMPVYLQPALLETLSPALRKRMQGKACFNFKQIDEPLFAELAELTQRSADALLVMLQEDSP